MGKWLAVLIVCAIGGWLAWRNASYGAAVPQPGSAAPDFSLPDQDGRFRSLSEFRGRWVVLYFYPRDDTPGCTTQACTFRDDFDLLHALGAQVLGVSVDSVASHAAFAQKYRLPFPLLADETGDTALRYGSLRDFALFRFARRNTFLIDPAGRVARAYVGVNPAGDAPQVALDLRTLQAPGAAQK